MSQAPPMTPQIRRSWRPFSVMGDTLASTMDTLHGNRKSFRMALIVVAAYTAIGGNFVSAAQKGENLNMNPQIVESFKEAVIANDLATIDVLLRQTPTLAAVKSEQGVSILLVALYRGHSDVAARIVAVRENLDIFEAAAMGKLARVRSLLDADARTLNTYSADGFTPLHLATFFGRFELVRFILANGGNVEASARNDSKVRPIHSAAATRDVRMVRVILSAGADPDARQTGGHTALHSAALHGNVPMTIALLAAGADPAVQNDESKSAMDLDARENSDTIKNLLQSRCGF